MDIMTFSQSFIPGIFQQSPQSLATARVDSVVSADDQSDTNYCDCEDQDSQQTTRAVPHRGNNQPHRANNCER
jgi:hypothetical protein